MEPQVRTAGREDVDALAQLRWNMHTEEESATEDYVGFLARFRLFAERAVDSWSWRIWVAEVDGHIVGNLWLQLVARVPRPIKSRPHRAALPERWVGITDAARGG